MIKLTIRRALQSLLLPVALFLTAFVVFAQDGGVEPPVLPSDVGDVGGWIKLLFAAGMSKNWWLLAALAVTFLVGGLRKWVPGHTVVGKFIAGPIGGLITNVLVTWSGALSLMMLAGQPFDADLVLRAVQITLAASGTWSIWKNIRQGITDAAAKKAGEAAAKTPGDTLNK